MADPSAAEIFYGVQLGDHGTWTNDPDDTELPNWITQDPDPVVAEAVDPTVIRPEDDRWVSAEYQEYLAKRREAIESCPVIFTYGGPNLDAPEVFMAVKASLTKTDWRENPKSLTSEPVVSTSSVTLGLWALTLRKWADKLGLPEAQVNAANPEGPRWILITS